MIARIPLYISVNSQFMFKILTVNIFRLQNDRNRVCTRNSYNSLENSTNYVETSDTDRTNLFKIE